jgi:hypothetical protein
LTKNLQLQILENSKSSGEFYDIVSDINEIDRQLSNLPVLIDDEIYKVMEEEESQPEQVFERLQKTAGGIVRGPAVPFTKENPADRINPLTGEPYQEEKRVGFSLGGKVASFVAKNIGQPESVNESMLTQRFGKTYKSDALAEQMERLAITRDPGGSTKFVSPSLKVMIERGPQNIKGPQILDWLKASTNKGIKPDEVKELGIESYVKENPQATLSEVVEAVSPRQTKLTKAIKGTPSKDVEFETKIAEYDPIDNTPLWSNIREEMDYSLKQGSFDSDEAQKDIVNFFRDNYFYEGPRSNIKNLNDVMDLVSKGAKPSSANVFRDFTVNPVNTLDDLVDEFARAEYQQNPYKLITPKDSALREVSSEFGGESFAFGNEDVGYTFYIGGRRNDDLASVFSDTEAEITLERLLQESFPRQAGALDSYQYKQYIDRNLPGGDNYREVVFELADAKVPSNVSNHFDEENYLAHALVRDRKLADNTKTLHIDELQSDLHKQAKDFEYATPENINKAMKKIEETEKEIIDYYSTKVEPILDKYDLLDLIENSRKTYLDSESITPSNTINFINDINRYTKQKLGSDLSYSSAPKDIKNTLISFEDIANKLRDLRINKNRLIPDYPYKENWHTAVINRLLAEAIDEGYDAISLSPAKVLSDRYVSRYDEFYSNLYDKKVPSYLQKLARRYKGKFEKGELDVADTHGKRHLTGELYPASSKDELNKIELQNIKVNILKITPEMRELLEKEGLQAFNEGGLVGKVNK